MHNIKYILLYWCVLNPWLVGSADAADHSIKAVDASSTLAIEQVRITATSTVRFSDFRVGHPGVIAEMNVINNRWVIQIRKGYGLLDLFVLIGELPNGPLPLAETLVRAIERRWKECPKTSRPPVVDIMPPLVEGYFEYYTPARP